MGTLISAKVTSKKIEPHLEYVSGACVAQQWRNGLPCDGPGFDSRWERCIYRAFTTFARDSKWGCRL